MKTSDLPEFLERGERARLIPVVADTSKEGRAASIFLATVMAVDEFAAAMLGSVGVRLGKRAKVRCFTEVVLRESAGDVRLRPDGLILVDTGKSRWSALLEAKIGKADIEEEQLKSYIQLARANGIDAVITLSNQFTAMPDHLPVPVPKALTKGVELFHWSWMFVLTQATLLLHNNEFASADQRFVMKEVVRHFSHDSAGVSSFDRMNAEWKDLILKVQSDAPLNRALPEVERTVASWHQEERDLCLIMSRKIGRGVHLRLPRAHINDQVQRVRDDCDALVRTKALCCEMDVPDAAAPLCVSAHLGRRTIICSMKLPAPKDKKRTSARINWLLRQLTASDAANVFIKASWPGRAQDTQASLAEARANPACLESENKALTPVAFEVSMVRDMAGKFSGNKTFIEGIEEFVPLYYENVGQHLRAWVAAPPKVIASAQPDVDMDDEVVVADQPEPPPAEPAPDPEVVSTPVEAVADGASPKRHDGVETMLASSDDA